MQNLSSILLSKHWETMKEKVNTTLNDNNIDMRNLHIQTINILKEIADRAGMIEYLEIILEKNGYISESIFYFFSGYPEKILIQPKVWLQK